MGARVAVGSGQTQGGEGRDKGQGGHLAAEPFIGGHQRRTELLSERDERRVVERQLERPRQFKRQDDLWRGWGMNRELDVEQIREMSDGRLLEAFRRGIPQDVADFVHTQHRNVELAPTADVIVQQPLRRFRVGLTGKEEPLANDRAIDHEVFHPGPYRSSRIRRMREVTVSPLGNRRRVDKMRFAACCMALRSLVVRWITVVVMYVRMASRTSSLRLRRSAFASASTSLRNASGNEIITLLIGSPLCRA